MQDTVVVRPRLRRLAPYVGASLAFVAIGIWMIAEGEPSGWLVTAFFGLCLAVFVVVARRPLVLGSAGIRFPGPRGAELAWEDTAGAVADDEGIHVELSPAFLARNVRARGRVGPLTTQIPKWYGETPEQLAQTINALRERHAGELVIAEADLDAIEIELEADPIVRAGDRGFRGAVVLALLVAANVAVYVVQAVQAGGVLAPGGSWFEQGALHGPAVAAGDWWRLFTAAFLHADVVHLGANMLALAWLGWFVESTLGAGRFLLLYVGAALAGSLGALALTYESVTVGASGAVFGILGAAVVLGRRGTQTLLAIAAGMLVVGLIYTFTEPNVSVGAHLGGLMAGIVVARAFDRHATRVVQAA